jgi:hypothetical protein
VHLTLTNGLVLTTTSYASRRIWLLVCKIVVSTELVGISLRQARRLSFSAEVGSQKEQSNSL